MNKKYHFFDDYSEGAHPRILEAFQRTNLQQELGYGKDSFALEAADLIRKKIDNPEADVHFVSTGTQANLVALASMLKPYESVIATTSGHISLHETGSIEATGHKINEIDVPDGKLTPEGIKKVVELHNFDQMVKPRVVYISQATELGTVYTQKELEAIRSVCDKHQLYLYADGARLGGALACEGTGLDFASFSTLVDFFYIGGTKNGGLIGEAIVINHPELQENFRFHLRQRGAFLAKARAVTVQFVEFFRDDLYLESARHANAMAQKVAAGIRKQGHRFLVESPTNQIFPIFPNGLMKKLEEIYGFYFWERVGDEHSAIRLVTSWATPETAVEEFLRDLEKLSS